MLSLILQMTEWNERAEKFHEIRRSVEEMFVRLTETSNRALLYDLYPYVWDIKEVLQLLDTFVNWLSTKNNRKKQKGQSFYPEDPEPWVFRGGLCGELQVCWACNQSESLAHTLYVIRTYISMFNLHLSNECSK